MSIYDKISNAQETTWLTDGIAEAEAKSIIELAKISAKIERRRLELNMTQKEFAAYMYHKVWYHVGKAENTISQ